MNGESISVLYLFVDFFVEHGAYLRVPPILNTENRVVEAPFQVFELGMLVKPWVSPRPIITVRLKLHGLDRRCHFVVITVEVVLPIGGNKL